MLCHRQPVRLSHRGPWCPQQSKRQQGMPRRRGRTLWRPRLWRATRWPSNPRRGSGSWQDWCASVVAAVPAAPWPRRWHAFPSPRDKGAFDPSDYPAAPTRPRHPATPWPRSSRAGSSTRLFAALMVTETCPGFMNTHSAVPDVNPTNPASAGIPSDIRSKPEMDVENRLELVGRRQLRAAGRGQPRVAPRARRHPRGPSGIGPSGWRSPVTRPPSMVSSAMRLLNLISAPRACRVAIAGSTNASDRPFLGNIGTQAWPPAHAGSLASQRPADGQDLPARVCSGPRPPEAPAVASTGIRGACSHRRACRRGYARSAPYPR